MELLPGHHHHSHLNEEEEVIPLDKLMPRRRNTKIAEFDGLNKAWKMIRSQKKRY